MGEQMLSVRGHHLLCILGFRGRGYDQRFVQNMSRLVATIRENPHVIVVVGDHCDDICSACPYRADGCCRKKPHAEEALRKGDRAVLTRLALGPGDRREAGELYGCLAAHFGPADLERGPCVDCEWRELGFCKDGLEALQRGEFFAGAARSDRTAGH